jgi:hypothetical protein
MGNYTALDIIQREVDGLNAVLEHLRRRLNSHKHNIYGSSVNF